MNQRLEELLNTIKILLKTEQKMELNMTLWSNTEILSFKILY